MDITETETRIVKRSLLKIREIFPGVGGGLTPDEQHLLDKCNVELHETDVTPVVAPLAPIIKTGGTVV